MIPVGLLATFRQPNLVFLTGGLLTFASGYAYTIVKSDGTINKSGVTVPGEWHVNGPVAGLPTHELRCTSKAGSGLTQNFTLGAWVAIGYNEMVWSTGYGGRFLLEIRKASDTSKILASAEYWTAGYSP